MEAIKSTIVLAICLLPQKFGERVACYRISSLNSLISDKSTMNPSGFFNILCASDNAPTIFEEGDFKSLESGPQQEIVIADGSELGKAFCNGFQVRLPSAAPPDLNCVPAAQGLGLSFIPSLQELELSLAARGTLGVGVQAGKIHTRKTIFPEIHS